MNGHTSEWVNKHTNSTNTYINKHNVYSTRSSPPTATPFSRRESVSVCGTTNCMWAEVYPLFGRVSAPRHTRWSMLPPIPESVPLHLYQSTNKSTNLPISSYQSTNKSISQLTYPFLHLSIYLSIQHGVKRVRANTSMSLDSQRPPSPRARDWTPTKTQARQPARTSATSSSAHHCSQCSANAQANGAVMSSQPVKETREPNLPNDSDPGQALRSRVAPPTASEWTPIPVRLLLRAGLQAGIAARTAGGDTSR